MLSNSTCSFLLSLAVLWKKILSKCLLIHSFSVGGTCSFNTLLICLVCHTRRLVLLQLCGFWNSLFSYGLKYGLRNLIPVLLLCRESVCLMHVALFTQPSRTFSDWRNFRLKQIKKNKNTEIIFVLNAHRILSCGNESSERDEGGGRILLGDNTGVGTVMLPPVSLHCVEFWFQLEWFIYIRIYLTMCVIIFSWSKIILAPDLPERNYWEWLYAITLRSSRIYWLRERTPDSP